MQATGILSLSRELEIPDADDSETGLRRTLDRSSEATPKTGDSSTGSPRRQDGTGPRGGTPGGDDPQGDDRSGQDEAGESASTGGGPDDGGLPSTGDFFMAQLEGERLGDRRRLRRTIVVATIFHLALLFFTLPDLGREPQFVGRQGKVYVMKQVRFQKPPAPAEQKREIPDPKKKRIPIPDPTPDEPEPLRIEDFEVPDVEPTLDADELFFGIPDAPDPGYFGESGDFTGDAYQVGDGIQAPVGIHQPQPRYTEEARQARVQGVVILTAVIDEEGNVKNLKAIKGLGLGLTESALKTVSEWKYKPAVNAEGQPVPVFYNITIGFWLQ